MADDKEQLLSSLCEILDIDRDLARYYLAKMRWSVEGAINEFYADTTEEADSNTLMTKPPSYSESEGESSHGSQSESDQPGNNNPGGDGASKLNLLCWNLDGLDEKDLEVRTAAVLNTILLKKPDVVLLQEVVPYSLKAFQDSCNGYMVLFGDFTVPYFNAFLIRKSSVQTKESALQFVEFPTSQMGRHYLIQPIKFADAKIILMTSHLESLGKNAAERKKQLKEVLDYMKRQNPGFNVLFGGDTNSRDSEVTAIGGLSADIQDAWTSCGSQLTTKYTWDMSANDNLRMSGGIYPETEDQIENHAEAASQRAVVPKSSYQCCVCQKTYSDISTTIRHIRYHVQRKASVAEPTLHCGQCGKSFTTKQQLNKHETVHTDARPFKCKDCDKWFKTLDNVKRHMFVHNDERPFVCPTCSKEFKAKHTLKKHEQTHDDERVFECPECDKKYKAKNSLRDHLRVHSGQRPYKCQQCDQAFYRPSHLATHKLVHSKLKPFSCKDCDKSFGRREHLKVHERIHSGEKPFKCNLCDRAFNQQAGLQAHVVSHSEDRPHTCVKCNKSFKYQSQVKHHACKPDEIEQMVNEDQRRTLGIGRDKVPLSMVYGHCGDEASSSEISSPTPCLNPTSTIIVIQIQSSPQTAMLSEGIEDAHRVIAPGGGSTRDEDSDDMLQGSIASSNIYRHCISPDQITVENSTTVSGEEAREMIAGPEDEIAREILEKIG